MNAGRLPQAFGGLMNKKLMRIGDPRSFFGYNERMRRHVLSEGRIVAEYPLTHELDVMDFRGHVWRVKK